MASGSKILDLLIKEMKASGISRSELAKRLNVTRGRSTQLLNPKSNLTLKSLASLEDALGIEFEVGIKRAPRPPAGPITRDSLRRLEELDE